MTLFLVRHGRPVIDRSRAAAEWELDPAYFDAVWALRDRLPAAAAWFTSPEPKAVQTAQLLTDAEIGIVEGLREHRRPAAWVEDFHRAVARAFERPDRPAYDGWEPISACRQRVVLTVRGLLEEHAGEDVVLVGHGTAWTLVVSALTGRAPDLDRWRTLELPDLWVV